MEWSFDFIHHSEFWMYVGIGFLAQLVDGALGMAYGTLCTAILLSAGVPPVTASASVHSAQFFTTGLSALSHMWFKNVNKKLFLALAVCGSMGGVLGALSLSYVDEKLIKPWVAIYLFCLGILILWKRYRRTQLVKSDIKSKTVFHRVLGFIGGFLDALGGGWGPMVTSNLMVRNEDPRLVIGSVNSAEFFVKTTIALTFILTVAFSFHEVVLGLLAGGLVAAPFGAFILRYIKAEILITLVGVVITTLSLYVLYNVLF